MLLKPQKNWRPYKERLQCCSSASVAVVTDSGLTGCQQHWAVRCDAVDFRVSFSYTITGIQLHFYPRDVVSAVYATGTWLGG